MSSTASHNLATFPNVQTTKLKYPYRHYTVPEQTVRFSCCWTMLESGRDEVFNMFLSATDMFSVSEVFVLETVKMMSDLV